jgi:hypothetical protein
MLLQAKLPCPARFNTAVALVSARDAVISFVGPELSSKGTKQALQLFPDAPRTQNAPRTVNSRDSFVILCSFNGWVVDGSRVGRPAATWKGS